MLSATSLNKTLLKNTSHFSCVHEGMSAELLTFPCVDITRTSDLQSLSIKYVHM